MYSIRKSRRLKLSSLSLMMVQLGNAEGGEEEDGGGAVAALMAVSIPST